MKRALAALLLIVAVTAPVGADALEDHLDHARELHAHGDFAHARDELLAAFQLAPRPELLFALGQVEFNLGSYQAAIDYYQRFMQSSPTAEQAALAQQAIGAARVKLGQPVVRHVAVRDWDRYDRVIGAIGGVSILVGAGLFYDGHRLSDDRSGTLAAYNSRISTAHSAQLAGAICGGVGVVMTAASIVRWRFHLIDTTIEVHAAAGGASVTIGGSL